ncbi:MAG: hypothetical protein ACRD9R_03335 [Pyrinomonadaceae bacterium]
MIKNFISVFLLVFIGTAFDLSARAAPLNGVIKSEKGQSIPNVKVLTYAPLQRQTEYPAQRYEVISDAKGRFRLPAHGRIVHFTHPEQRPVTKILPLSATTIQVVMEEVTATLWKVPQCQVESGRTRTGIAFKVVAPDDVQAKNGVRFDLDTYFYGYQMPDGKFEVMVNWQDSTSSHPSEETLLEAKHFTERVWVSGERFGYDTRGERRDGKVWRFVNYRWGAISYQGNSREAAKAFDKMIDGMCFDEEDAKKYPNENF